MVGKREGARGGRTPGLGRWVTGSESQEQGGSVPSGWEGRRRLGIVGKAGSVRRKTLGRKVRGGKDAVGRREGGSLECCRGDGAGGKAEGVGGKVG